MPYKLTPCRPVIGGKNEYYQGKNESIIEIKAVAKSHDFDDQLGHARCLRYCKTLADLEDAELKIVRSCVPTYEMQDAVTRYVEDNVRVMKTTRKSKDGCFDLAMVNREDARKFLGYVTLPDGKNINPRNVALAYVDQTKVMSEFPEEWLSFADICKSGYIDTSEYVLFTDPLAVKRSMGKRYMALYLTYPMIVDGQGNAMPEAVKKAEIALAEIYNRVCDSLDGVAYIGSLYDKDGVLRNSRNENLMISRERMTNTREEIPYIGSFNNVNEAIEFLRKRG